jgi:epidermal growth factor receptor substrate 15
MDVAVDKNLQEDYKKSLEYIEELKKLQIKNELEINEHKANIGKKDKIIEDLNRKLEGQNDSKEDIPVFYDKINNLEMKIIQLNRENEDLQEEKKRLLEERDELNKNLASSNNLTTSIDHLTKQNDEEKIFSQNLLKEREDLENKITKMKSSVQEIKDKFEEEMNNKLKTLKESNSELEKRAKDLDENCKKLSKDYKLKHKEKLELEEIILKQDEKVTILANKINYIDKMLKEKNKEIQENEINVGKLVDIIEDQKKNINELNNKLMKYEFNDRDNETAQLKNQINNLKKELDCKIILT